MTTKAIVKITNTGVEDLPVKFHDDRPGAQTAVLKPGSTLEWPLGPREGLTVGGAP